MPELQTKVKKNMLLTLMLRKSVAQKQMGHIANV